MERLNAALEKGTAQPQKQPLSRLPRKPQQGVTEGVTSGKLGVTDRKKPERLNSVTLDGKHYDRETHEAFFKVLDWFQDHPLERAEWGLGKIAKDTGVSKPYVSKARQWWQENSDGAH